MKIRQSWLPLSLFALITTFGLHMLPATASFNEGGGAGDAKALEKQLADANKQIKVLGEEKKKLADSLSTQAGQVKALEKQLVEANQQLKKVIEEKKKTTDSGDKVKTLEKQLAEAQKQNKALSEEVAKLTKAAGADAEKIKALTGEKVKLADLAVARGKELDIKDKLLAEATKQSKAFADEKAKLEKARLADADQTKKLLSTIDETSAKLTKSDKALASEKKLSAKLTGTISEKNQTIEYVKKSLVAATARADAHAAKMSELEKSLTETKHRADDLDSQLLSLQLELSSRCRIVTMLRGGCHSRQVRTCR